MGFVGWLALGLSTNETEKEYHQFHSSCIQEIFIAHLLCVRGAGETAVNKSRSSYSELGGVGNKHSKE